MSSFLDRLSRAMTMDDLDAMRNDPVLKPHFDRFEKEGGPSLLPLIPPGSIRAKRKPASFHRKTSILAHRGRH